jgi:hypothetical protein
VFRLPRVDLCQTPLYRSPGFIAVHRNFLSNLEPKQGEIDSKFDATYVNEVKENHSITQQFSGVGMLPMHWTQTPANMLPRNTIVDRRCNWDTYFVYAKNYYDYSQTYRLRHYATYAGLLPAHDLLVFEDFDHTVKHFLKWVIDGSEPAITITRYSEVSYCPNSHMDPNRHNCGWCNELTMRAPQGSFIPGTVCIRVSRHVHKHCWFEAEAPRDPDTDMSSGPSYSSAEEEDEERKTDPQIGETEDSQEGLDNTTPPQPLSGVHTPTETTQHRTNSLGMFFASPTPPGAGLRKP